MLAEDMYLKDSREFDDKCWVCHLVNHPIDQSCLSDVIWAQDKDRVGAPGGNGVTHQARQLMVDFSMESVDKITPLLTLEFPRQFLENHFHWFSVRIGIPLPLSFVFSHPQFLSYTHQRFVRGPERDEVTDDSDTSFTSIHFDYVSFFLSYWYFRHFVKLNGLQTSYDFNDRPTLTEQKNQNMSIWQKRGLFCGVRSFANVTLRICILFQWISFSDLWDNIGFDLKYEVHVKTVKRCL